MRLTAEQARLIRDAVHQRFGPEARVWLFGSRVNDKARGGGIDYRTPREVFAQCLVEEQEKASKIAAS